MKLCRMRAMVHRSAEEFASVLSALILVEGISTLTIGDIAARLGCSRRRIYELASTKEELFILVTRKMFESVLIEGDLAAQAETDPVAAIEAYLAVGVQQTSRLTGAYLDDIEASDQARALYEDFIVTRSRKLASLIDEATRCGIFALGYNSMLIAEALFGASRRTRRAGFLATTGMTLDEASSQLLSLFLTGLFKR
jgi:AcrR family transcriptional regulator